MSVALPLTSRAATTPDHASHNAGRPGADEGQAREIHLKNQTEEPIINFDRLREHGEASMANQAKLTAHTVTPATHKDVLAAKNKEIEELRKAAMLREAEIQRLEGRVTAMEREGAATGKSRLRCCYFG